ncbi:putative 3-demethylubiquinone-9 3-methyltransferase (glyoxalase superfamily) [Dyadobacter sp. BE34]|uniref:3-demethylubiquinone-9 3-methyltransferase (Glyoxalase superfamily) n=1 Tax=Dyadobacter fermentans TaxID=94254 RepID=A0ABU1QXK5_9BACT|nr:MULTISPECIES: VOC family protein [Dyadobacter]MDR6805445.1 putative 3-demethylubiquinone-9 3-methyltransferase (glyoxalase superfamily) [Dyadobacter fermentans]MDR7042795.1 putative 3-demethylubiquinone-9 3-methyltransferase (glyoxalase superfamily) [Dyadobacter sp. BE242]MDR7197107.1 putative 3-demethylubiquinone-9 3-methyltransferase (glyoxalase superfamily) [Dyadobacter sp. BE34]MDR7215458.1 putative 3-demethylubiquinone-9 3-methyltransferase (glyoxalase superfamily) [Dyadobacter sp. BE31
MSELSTTQGITPFLWYNGQAEEAMNLYTSLFPNSRIKQLKKWGEGSHMPADQVMMGVIEINGLTLHLFDAGPMFKFTEAVSFFVSCKDQQEIDHYWNALTADGGQESQCGWLKDKFGLSWQIVPAMLTERLSNGDPKRAGQMFQAVMGMQKLDIAEMERAYNQ